MIDRKKLCYLWLIIGFSLSFFLVSNLAYFHEADIWTFIGWSEYWTHGARDVYSNCKTCNYPILGLLATGGVISLLKVFNLSSPQDIYQYYRYFLAIGDAFVFLLNSTLIRLLKIPYAIFVALLIALLPSSWAGSALWGQTDGIVQIWILLSLIGFLLSVKNIIEDVDGKHFYKGLTYFSVGVMSTVFGILTKQLFVVSLPTLLLLWVLNQYLILEKYGNKSFVRAILVNVFFLLILVSPDLYFRFPYEFRDHLNYIFFGGGSGNISWKYISWNGVNVWNLLGWKQLTPSTRTYWGPLSPLNSGMALFIFYLFALYIPLALKSLKSTSKLDALRDSWRVLAALFIFSSGLVYLGFNVLVPGTHERYMFHTYPLLIIPMIYFWYERRILSFRWVSYGSLCAFAYGTFVLKMIGLNIPILFVFQNHFFQIVIHFILLVLLTDVWFRLCMQPIKNQSFHQID